MIATKKKAKEASLFDEVVDVIGVEAASKLMERTGGESHIIPMNPTPTLIELIGQPAARLLCDEFQGIKVHIPKTSKLDRQERNLRILEALARHESYTSVAEQEGVSVRTVYYVRRRQLGI